MPSSAHSATRDAGECTGPSGARSTRSQDCATPPSVAPTARPPTLTPSEAGKLSLRSERRMYVLIPSAMPTCRRGASTSIGPVDDACSTAQPTSTAKTTLGTSEPLNVRSDGAEILVISGSLNGAPSLVPSLGGLGAPRTSANRTVVSTFSPLWRRERDRMRRTSYACSTCFFSDSLDEEASFLFFFFRMMSNEDASFSVSPSKRSASGKEIVDEDASSPASETCGGESSLESDPSPDGGSPPGEEQ